MKIKVGGEKISLDSLKLDAASLTLYGTTGVKALPGLESLMATAKLTTSDGREIACVDKFSAGTDADGRFTMNWIISEVIDPRVERRSSTRRIISQSSQTPPRPRFSRARTNTTR